MTSHPTRRRDRLARAVAVTSLVPLLALTACGGGSTAASTTPSGSAATSASAPVSAVPSSAAGYPVTVESCGRSAIYAQAPTRVVVGNENSLDTLDALGVSEAVYGYVLSPDDAGKAPAGLPARLVEVSSTPIPAREPVIAAQPDLFLAFTEAQLTTPGSLSYDDLQGVGANAYVLGAYCTQQPVAGSIETVWSDIAALGRIFGVPDRATALTATLQDRVAAAKASLGGRTATVAFLKVAGGKVYAIGGYPASAILDSLGLRNQFADLSTPFAELSTEQVLAMDPDVVLVNYVGDEAAAVAQLAAAVPELPAVRSGAVRGFDESAPQGGGVGVVEALENVARAVAATPAR